MNGLAQGGQIDPAMVQQVMEMLMQGANPEELLAQGVPREVLEIAMQQLQAQSQQGQGLAQAPVL